MKIIDLISVLPVISKIFERVVFNQLYDYFTRNNLFYQSQYGFRNIFIQLNLQYLKLLTESFHLWMRHTPIAFFLDLSKAFDTLHHRILLSKLKYYGIHDTPLKWFDSFLSNRSQFTEINSISSNISLIKTGVPQGSILGPLLFIIFTNDQPVMRALILIQSCILMTPVY